MPAVSTAGERLEGQAQRQGTAAQDIAGRDEGHGCCVRVVVWDRRDLRVEAFFLFCVRMSNKSLLRPRTKKKALPDGGGGSHHLPPG